MKATQYMVRCDIHGKAKTNQPADGKWLMVGSPKSRKDRREGGCPMCQQDKRNKA